MIINHNLMAQNTYRQFGVANAAQSNSMEKLSSGLRINRAGDDAAGLAISEKMRAQVRGLDQANTNAQDGISLIQTAEGALNETHSMLQRMRELATQAANDTYTDSDRQEIQKEINQLTSEINRVGNTTEFNTQKLLNANSVDVAAAREVTDGLKNRGWLSESEKLIKDYFGLEGTGNRTIAINLYAGEAYGKLASVSAPSKFGADMDLNIDLADFTPATGASGETVPSNGNSGFLADRIIAHEMVHAVMVDALGTNFSNLPTWFTEGTAELIHGGDSRVSGVLAKAGMTESKLIEHAKSLLDNTLSWTGSDEDYSAGYVITKYLSKNITSGTFVGFMQSLKTNNLTTAIQTATGKNTADFETAFSAATFTSYMNLTDTDTGSIAGSDYGGGLLTAEDVIPTPTTPVVNTEQPLSKFKIIWPKSSTSEVKLQIGANTGQSMSIQLEDMRSSALKIAGQAEGEVVASNGKTKASYTKMENGNGVTNGTDNTVNEYALDVSSHDKATAAIKVFDDAIIQVSSFRSKLGAYQNRLEHTMNNLQSTSENLTNAESRIRNVDMAKEMMEQTKQSILSQASQAMLAKANQNPQNILQLLR